MISAVKGGLGDNGVCFKAPDLVKILKVSRRWEGEEGKEAERTGVAKAHGGRKHCVVEKLRQAHMASALRASILHKVLMNIQEMDVRLPSAHKASYRGDSVREPCRFHSQTQNARCWQLDREVLLVSLFVL